ncbi:unnamed protein product [Strongylus vulgaris]|uniref:Uncharacterized protein n=1 Tax=Strongylus vulgaris TaxID=40348 RepID=A0A3P7LUT0_STRVU|nr:unnamed protein product [Strongylus vulgaris]
MDVFDEDMHMDCDFVNPGQVYWPNIQHLTVRTTEQQAPHLARCWAGSAGFDHRYEQQFAAKAQSVMI